MYWRLSLVALAGLLCGCGPRRGGRLEIADAIPLAPHDSLPAGTLRGRVVADRPGYPAGGAQVEVLDAGAAVTADSLGNFELRHLVPGVHRLRARRVGLRAIEGDIAMPAAGTLVRITLAVPLWCFDCSSPPPQPSGRIEAIP